MQYSSFIHKTRKNLDRQKNRVQEQEVDGGLALARCAADNRRQSRHPTHRHNNVLASSTRKQNSRLKNSLVNSISFENMCREALF